VLTKVEDRGWRIQILRLARTLTECEPLGQIGIELGAIAQVVEDRRIDLFEIERVKARGDRIGCLAAVNVLVEYAFNTDPCPLDADVVGGQEVEIGLQLQARLASCVLALLYHLN